MRESIGPRHYQGLHSWFWVRSEAHASMEAAALTRCSREWAIIAHLTRLEQRRCWVTNRADHGRSHRLERSGSRHHRCHQCWRVYNCRLTDSSDVIRDRRSEWRCRRHNLGTQLHSFVAQLELLLLAARTEWQAHYRHCWLQLQLLEMPCRYCRAKMAHRPVLQPGASGHRAGLVGRR